jgi:hypothetical protein
MISPQTVERLKHSGEQRCLTLYLNTNPSLPRTTYVSRFRDLVRKLSSRIAPEARKPFDAAVIRVARFLEQFQPNGSSCLVYAGEKTLEDFSSRVPVRDEVHWGRPDVSQLLWLLEEYRPYGVLIADKSHIRFLAVRLNEFECCEEFAADVDTTTWRKRVIGSAARGPSVQKGGVDSRAFDNRYAEQIRHFWRSLHRPLSGLVERYHVRRLVLAGNKSLLPEFAACLPANLSGAVVIRTTIDGFSSPTEAVRRIFPGIEQWEEEHDRKLVRGLLDAASIGARAAVGITPVLKHLQDGRASRLVAARGLDREVFECDCGFVMTQAGACPVCRGNQVRASSLAKVLAQIVARLSLPVDVVKHAPAEELLRNSGLGAFLRF